MTSEIKQRLVRKFASDSWLVGFLSDCMLANKRGYTVYLYFYGERKPPFEPAFEVYEENRELWINGVTIDGFIAKKDVALIKYCGV